jgi:hypothetical protein
MGNPLSSLGVTTADINAYNASFAGSAPIAGADSGGGDSSGWLSGLGDLFAGVGSAVSAGIKASNVPSGNVPSGWAYNPATGTYYNPATGQSLTATGTLTSLPGFVGGSSNIFLYLILAVVAFFLLRKKS